MASKKRKTLQIKRPDAHSTKSKKKTLPKVDVDDASATSAIDTDELSVAGPKTAKVQQPDVHHPNKPSATRIQLPDEDRIRKARRATATQDLGDSDALPSAEQIEQAQKSATMPIMIDTEDVQDQDQTQLSDVGEEGQKDQADQTMQIDPDALATGDVGEELEKAGQEESGSDQTMKIDADSLATGDVGEQLAEADQPEETSDQTMKIDTDSLATGDVGEQLAEADQPEETSDQTMKIDTDSLATGDVGEQLAEADQPEETSDQTMKIDADSLTTGEIDLEKHGEKMSQETMQMDPVDPEEAEKNKRDNAAFKAATMNMATQDLQEQPGNGEPEDDTDLSKEQLEESFNAMTMEMDSNQIANAMEEDNAKAQDEDEGDEGLDQTMDLTAQRPKTIMIKRPSKEAGSMTPTVKAVRPDAATVRTARPVTANTAQPKEGTSRIDIPEGEAGVTKEGKTIKLRRPAGGSGGGTSTVSRVATSAGLQMGTDGRYSAGPKQQQELGAGWLAVAIVSFLISLGAIWSVVAVEQVELPMPGRIVNANNQVMAPPSP